MNEFDTIGQDEVIDMQLVEAFADALEHDQPRLAPTATVMSYADDVTSRASTPPPDHYPSPR
eukprot:12779879-Prorocentrum_lima.AAC.1